MRIDTRGVVRVLALLIASGPIALGEGKDDPAIEGLKLSATARSAAYELKRKYPDVRFTSGRRDLPGQARAMASNVVHNRQWIKETYKQSLARDNCQKWVDDHPKAVTRAEIAEGLLGVFKALPPGEAGKISKHLSGDAFDVQPVTKDAAEIKAAIRALPGVNLFLEREGGLERWHVQF